MADGIYSQHGLPFDALGDVAQNDGVAGHQTRHKEVLLEKNVIGGKAVPSEERFRKALDKLKWARP